MSQKNRQKISFLVYLYENEITLSYVKKKKKDFCYLAQSNFRSIVDPFLPPVLNCLCHLNFKSSDVETFSCSLAIYVQHKSCVRQTAVWNSCLQSFYSKNMWRKSKQCCWLLDSPLLPSGVTYFRTHSLTDLFIYSFVCLFMWHLCNFTGKC